MPFRGTVQGLKGEPFHSCFLEVLELLSHIFIKKGKLNLVTDFQRLSDRGPKNSKAYRAYFMKHAAG